MRFKPENFRALALHDLPAPLREMESSSLVLVKKDGLVFFGRTALDKDHIRKSTGKGDIVLFAWHGKYRTDIFALDKDDLDRTFLNTVSAPTPIDDLL